MTLSPADIDNLEHDTTASARKTLLVDESGVNIGTTSNALDVNIASGSSAGTEYTEGATDTTITGTAVLGEAPSDTLKPLQLTASTNLKISIEEDSVGIGGGTQYNTNVAYQDADTGTLALTIRDDALTTLTEIDGDYSTLRVDSTGRLWSNVSNTVIVDATGQGDVPITLGGEVVSASQSGTWNVTNISGTVALPTGASTLAEQQSQTTQLTTIAGDTTSIQTAVELIDDAIYTDGTGTPSKGVAIMGTDGTNPQLVSVDSSGNLQVEVLTMPSTIVTATNLDIRDLTSVSDSVEVLQATHNNLNANANLQISDTDVSATNPVFVASEKSSSAGTSTGVTVGTGSTTVLASNANRKVAIIVNDSDEVIYLKYGTTAVGSSGIRLNSEGGSIREENYTGIITGICASGSKIVTVTEL